ncbi:MAG TPA: hypothetical protein VE344_03870 [Methylomirabilota bacterium]|nr:hypothetical protein [Methylomirabilota bacterium]
MNTIFSHVPATVVGSDDNRKKLGGHTGEEMARKKGLVTRGLGGKTSIARLEYKSGFACQFGIATTQSAGL